MASVNSGVEAWRGLVMLLTDFRFLIPGSFEMRKKIQMSSLWKRLENGLECWGEGSEEADFWLDHSLDWKESWQLDPGL